MRPADNLAMDISEPEHLPRKRKHSGCSDHNNAPSAGRAAKASETCVVEDVQVRFSSKIRCYRAEKGQLSHCTTALAICRAGYMPNYKLPSMHA